MELKFNVITYDPNGRSFTSYNILPYFIEQYNRTEDKPQTFEQFRQFIDREARWQFWARCQYEIILVDWPCQRDEKKIDVYDQIKMNLELITVLLMKSVKPE